MKRAAPKTLTHCASLSGAESWFFTHPYWRSSWIVRSA
jgi:hypothetical protein